MNPWRIDIDCSACNGSGKVELSKSLQAVLKQIARRNDGASAPMIYAALGDKFIGVTAINQRLDELHKLGLVERERRGKAYFYSIA